MKKILFLVVATLTLSCGVSRAPENPAPELLPAHTVVIRGTRSIPPAWTLRSKPATAQHAMVVAAHPLATLAGVEILKQGGNAIDAAVAVAFALQVVLPDAGNIGGGGFIVHRSAAGQVLALDYREAAPAGATHDMYLDSAGNPTDKSLVGHLASGVPGSVAGLYAALAYAPCPRDPAREWPYRGQRAQPRHRVRPGAACPVSRESRPVPSKRQRAGAGYAVEADGPRAHAAAHHRFRSRRLLPRSNRRSHRRRDAARRWSDHEERFARLSRQMAHASRVDVSRLHDLLDAATQLWRRDDGRDPEHPRGLRHDSGAGHARVRASARRGDASRVHRPEPLARRPRLRPDADRASALEVVRGVVALGDRSPACDTDSAVHHDGWRRPHYALLDRRRKGKRGLGYDNPERRFREWCHGDGRRLPP